MDRLSLPRLLKSTERPCDWPVLGTRLLLAMEVLEGQAAWLSDFEVLQHLRERREKREEAGRSIPAAENVQTIEFEASVY